QGLCGPGIGADLARSRDAVEGPLQFSSTHIKSANVAGCGVVIGAARGQGNDDRVLMNASRVAAWPGDLTVRLRARIHAAGIAESHYRFSGARVEFLDDAAVYDDPAAIGAISALPVVHAARGCVAAAEPE